MKYLRNIYYLYAYLYERMIDLNYRNKIIQTREERKMVEIRYGEYSELAELAGVSVAEVREQYKSGGSIYYGLQEKFYCRTQNISW